MSNLYLTEPATTGKVIVETTLGEIEIELWCKEAPKACRNFFALVMEGYYDGVIFHRIVPNFIAQTGDPSGTGMGGESYYGEPFENETHSRLKFNRRGLVAFANNGDKCSNTSQWFITLDRADELQNKHTLFGKVVGSTIYNVLKLNELEIDKQERPLYPPKIIGIRIIENPFTDIVPRITAAERKAQHEARLEAQREAERREQRRKAKKNTGLLSFGEEAESVEAAEAAAAKRINISRPDLVDPGTPSVPAPTFDSKPAEPSSSKTEGKSPTTKASREKSEEPADLGDIRARHAAEKEAAATARKQEIERMQAKLRKLDKRRARSDDDSSDSDDDDDGGDRKRKRTGPSVLDQELAKYAAGRRGNRRGARKDEDDVLSTLSSFTSKIRKNAPGEDEKRDPEGEAPDAEAEEGLEVDDDVGWMSHALKAVNDGNADQSRRAETDYTVIDPRAKARAIKEEKRRDEGRGGRHSRR
ncbi:Peptidyl-prolyl isomerase cwc27 [Naganishia albida]|nr:Peptidyl-prolyl isomerase cwc27 [Naganishia albida]